ncbi:4302_t:CDS:1, partial [Cetraspora pellucida]
LEDSDIEEETILSFKNTKTYTQPNSKYILYSILSNTFKDSFNLTIQWVLLWIFSFQQAFILPYTAVTALLIFIKALVFNNDSNFLETLYKAKDAISFKKTIIQFVVCEKCHFLTNLESISNNSQASCSECKTLLKKLIITSKGKIIYKPIKVYPYQSILSQLATLLQRPGFEELLESCYERGNTSSDIFSDLYDGQV